MPNQHISNLIFHFSARDAQVDESVFALDQARTCDQVVNQSEEARSRIDFVQRHGTASHCLDD
jgi:hypothetical protein